MKNYHIFITSNEHPRTINTPKMARTYFTCFTVKGWEAMENKVAELRKAGENVYEISTDLGKRIWI